MTTIIIWSLLIGVLINTYFCIFISNDSIGKIITWWIAYFFISLIMLGVYLAYEVNNKINEDPGKDKNKK